MTPVTLPNDIKIFGVRVKTFPLGIDEAFARLVNMIPGGFNRSYYGVSYMEGNEMVYYSEAEELNPGEAGKYSCERLVIEKGEYITATLYEWQNKTGGIKDIFQQLVNDLRTDKTKPGIEWYKNEEEMVCMLRTIVQN